MEKVATKKDVAAPQVNEHSAEKSAEFKAKKAEAAKRWKEKKQEQAKKLQEGSKKILEIIDAQKVKLPEDLRKLLEETANPVRAVAAKSSTNGIFNKMFGDTPKVGDSVTLMDVFKKTFKSKADIDRLVKGWVAKGTVVEFTAKPNMLESVYTIKAIGN